MEVDLTLSSLSRRFPVAVNMGTTRLPLSRIKNIMKSDPDVTMISQETTFAMAKATVLPRCSYGQVSQPMNNLLVFRQRYV